jgi:hypothetical protein
MLISTDKAIVPYLVIVLSINAAKVAQKSDLTKFLSNLYLQKEFFTIFVPKLSNKVLPTRKQRNEENIVCITGSNHACHAS